MNCDAVQLVLAKAETDASVMSEAEVAAREHVATCDACKRALAAHWQLARRVRQAGQSKHAPEDLRARIVSSLDSEQLQGFVLDAPRRRPATRWLGAAAIVAAAASVVFFMATNNSDELPLGSRLVAVVEAASPTDSMMVSSDFIQLGQWLESQVGYGVQVPAIANAALLGARVTEVGALRTAVITYRMPEGNLTYFALPAADGNTLGHEKVETLSAGGYQVATWTEYGAQRAVVGMLPRDQVRAIAEECRHTALNPVAL